MRPPWLIALLLASALSLAGCAGAEEKLIGIGTGPRVTGEPSDPSANASTRAPDAPAARRPSPARAVPVGLKASKPVRVEIPALQVAQQTIELGLMADGTMEVPIGPGPIGWFAESPTPGEIGPAVLAGHRPGTVPTESSDTSRH